MAEIASRELRNDRESGRPLDQVEQPDELAISVITVGELRAGVLAAADVETGGWRH